MQHSPAQVAHRKILVDVLDHVEQVVDGAVRVPVQLDGVALRRRPAQQFGKLRLAVGRDVAVGPVGPDQDFAGAVEVQHRVAKSRRRELRQVLQVGELAAGLWRAEVIGDAHGQLLVLPQPEHGLVARRIHADAAAIDDAGDAEAVHLAEEFFGAVDLLLHGRLRQFVENLAERGAAGVDDAGRLVVAIARELAAGRHIVVVADVQRLHRLRRQQQPVIEMLDVDGIVGRNWLRPPPVLVGASRQTAPRSSRRRRRSRIRASAPLQLDRSSPARLSARARRSSSPRCRRSARRGCRGCVRR